MYTDLALYIDGKWVNGNGREGEEVLNPATEKPLAHLPHASKADLDEALEAAKKGFALWRATSAYDRAKIMRKAADLMRERHDAISKILVQEQGKVYVEARAEVVTSADITPNADGSFHSRATPITFAPVARNSWQTAVPNPPLAPVIRTFIG